MRRWSTVVILCSLVVAGCAGDDLAATATVASTTTTGAPATTSAAANTSTSAVVAPTTTVPIEVPPVVRPATVDELLAIGRPIVLAHTAGEDEFPASTLFAFGESVKAGVDVLDLNINLTSDGELLVQHDTTVDRNTDGTGNVIDMTAAEIAELDAAYWFTAACADCRDRPEGEYLYRGIRTGDVPPPAGYSADDFALPTLRQLVERFPDLPLNIEIKGEGNVALRTADVLAEQLVELGRAEASIVASFEDDVVSYFHAIAPDVEVSPGLGVLTAYVLDKTPLPDGMRILQLPPVYSGLEVITPELVARATADGYPIWVWPNDRALENLASYKAFLELGIVGLNINFPAQGVQAVREFLPAGT
jgi:glycerophosphoryl diester phosphodiesterase